MQPLVFSHEPSLIRSTFTLCWVSCVQNQAMSIGKFINSKPNEDSAIFDPVREIFIVCDGVSHRPERTDRCHLYPPKSLSQMAANIFAVNVHSTLTNLLREKDKDSGQQPPRPDYSALLKTAVNIGNKAVLNLNVTHNNGQEPDFINADLGSTCAIVAFIRGGMFYYCYIGDCAGYRLPKATGTDTPTWERFTKNQVAAYEEWRDSQTQEERQKPEFIQNRNSYIRNNKDHDLGYGVITGEKKALDMVDYDSFPVGPQAPYSKVVLASDGYEALFLRRPEIVITTPGHLLSEALALERSNNVTDDKTIVVVGFKR